MPNICRHAKKSGISAAKHGIGGAVEDRVADTSVRSMGIPARPL